MTTDSFDALVNVDTAPLAWGADGLMPAIVIDEDGVVLMLAYMDKEALNRTRSSGRTWFYSRSRREYWAKGETSGNTQEVLDVLADCDRDTLLIRVRQAGNGACHTGSYSCFTQRIATAQARTDLPVTERKLRSQ